MMTLTSLLTRARAVLVDAEGAAWSDALLTEGARLALGEYALAAGAAAALSGLDGADETSLPEAHESMIVWGAAGYAAASRGLDLAEAAQLGEEGPALLRWGETRLAEFRVMLGAAFPGYGAGGEARDPAKAAAEVDLLAAQTALAAAQTAAVTGQESRAASAAAQASADRAAEAQRLAALRSAEAGSPWGGWRDEEGMGFEP